jgi:hypothetical protein
MGVAALISTTPVDGKRSGPAGPAIVAENYPDFTNMNPS